MTEHNDKVEKRRIQLFREKDMNAISCIIGYKNAPLGEDYIEYRYNSGKVIRKYADKRKKDVVITEAHRT
jgi:hypothetical protein